MALEPVLIFNDKDWSLNWIIHQPFTPRASSWVCLLLCATKSWTQKISSLVSNSISVDSAQQTERNCSTRYLCRVFRSTSVSAVGRKMMNVSQLYLCGCCTALNTKTIMWRHLELQKSKCCCCKNFFLSLRHSALPTDNSGRAYLPLLVYWCRHPNFTSSLRIRSTEYSRAGRFQKHKLLVQIQSDSDSDYFKLQRKTPSNQTFLILNSGKMLFFRLRTGSLGSDLWD